MSAVSRCTCAKYECGVNDRVYKYSKEQKLIQFPMGLNTCYTTVRGNILMMIPFPSMSQAYSLLVQTKKTYR